MKAKSTIPQKTVKDFYNYDFESCDVPEDCYGDYPHANFFKKYAVPIFRKELKKMAKNMGAEVVVNGSYFCISGFFMKNNNFVYFSIGDVRYNVCGHWYDKVLYRRAASVTDYTGGANHYCSFGSLESDVCCMLNDEIPF